MAYLDERLALLPRLQKLAQGQAVQAALRLDGQALRFHLGTSLADLAVPVAVDPALEAAVGAAARDLLFLLALRHRAALRDDEYDKLLLQDGFDPQRHRPPSFGPPSTVARQGVAVAFNEAPELHPALDSGTLAAWIGVGRPGRTLVGLLHALLKGAGSEEAGSDVREPTPYLALLALRQTFPARVIAELKSIPLAAPVGRVLQGAVAAGLLAALRLAARESGALDAESGFRLQCALSPLTWLLEGRLLPGSGLTAYGVAFLDAVPKLDALVQKLAASHAPDDAVAQAAAWCEPGGELHNSAARSVAHALVRRELLALLRLIESGRAPSFSLDGVPVAQLFGQPLAVERALSTPERRKELAARLKEVGRALGKRSERERLEEAARMAADYREDEPARALPRDEPQRTFARALVGVAMDVLVERACVRAQAQLQMRSGEEREGGIEEERERGRLYFFTAEGPILKSRSRAVPMGHLFCDVKDFTRRTAFLKEAVVADFLSREFYGPILTAAGKHFRGASHLGDRGGIYLNNLLGDAVSISGEITALVELAHDIRKALRSYSQRLQQEATTEAVARAISVIDERYLEPRKSVLAAAQVARKDAAANPARPDLRRRAEELTRELQRLEEEREAELALARGEQLEAGIFLSYGSAPEVATFDDAVFGPVKVSIAEKINESARGTARNAGVRARVDSLVAGARASRRDVGVICPFSVSIAQPLTIRVSPAEEADVRALLARGERTVAEGVLAEAVRRSVDEFAFKPEGVGDIYNGGAALSDEALEAYLEARGREVLFLRRERDVQHLHSSLQQRFVFPLARLRIVAGVSHATGGLEELYVLVGRALFKGFEKQGGLAVWEMVPPASPFFSALAEHELPGWLREEQDGSFHEPAARAMNDG